MEITLEPMSIDDDFAFRYAVYTATIRPYLDDIVDWSDDGELISVQGVDEVDVAIDDPDCLTISYTTEDGESRMLTVPEAETVLAVLA